ncbi:DUF4232 domain-containing protein [Streptomyces sp. BYX5S]
MSARFANRSGRLVLTAVAAVSLSLAATACSSGTGSSGKHSTSTGSRSDAKSGAKTDSDTDTQDGADAQAASKTDATGGSGSGSGSAGKSGQSGKSADKGIGQSCGTNDLDFTVSAQSQAGGYYLLTAKAKPGITCYLEGTTADVAFGSAADTHVSPADQAVTDSIKLSGSVKAYAGVNPKSVNENGGKEFGQLIVSVGDTGIDPVSLKLPDTAEVNRPTATNWHADPADAVPAA